jgi:hypothetical protein
MFCGNFKSANHVHLFQEFKTLDSEEPPFPLGKRRIGWYRQRTE